MPSKDSEIYSSKKGERVYLKTSRRRKKTRMRKLGFKRYVNLLRKKHNKDLGKFVAPKFITQRFYNSLGKKPAYGDIITFLLSVYEKLSDEPVINNDGILHVPETFSISENYEETMHFLKELFYLLHECRVEVLTIDYENCIYLDVDASAFMDLILADFINYYNKCVRRGHKIRIKSIRPINFTKEEIFKVLFSIGAYKNIKGIELKQDEQNSDFLPFGLLIGDKVTDEEGNLKEIHETQIVDYVLNCLEVSGHSLTPEAESHLSKVVGEVMANAEEHSKFRYRFAIGYFVKPKPINNPLGLFKLSIFNFGQTVYESFKDEELEDSDVVTRMKELSEHYTSNGLFRRAKYEEQTLWTLYALQEGVTSKKDWKRGKGTIRFIDRFFRLRNCNHDNKSKLTLVSGNTKIIFDGTYPLVEVSKGKNNKTFQMMTLNKSGDIKEQPDNNFITFVPHYFPGTLISAKIYINPNNVEDIRFQN